MDFEKLKNEPYIAFLHSGRLPATASFLAYGAKNKISSLQGLKDLKARAYGYIGYNIRHELESYVQDSPSYIPTPPVQFFEAQHEEVFENLKLPQSNCAPEIKSFSSNMSKAEYLQKVESVIEKIKAGDLYQANLTRKFYGEFETAPDAFAIFCALAKISPAPYSAFMRLGDTYIISASPESFMKIQQGRVTTIPIKGTLPSARPAHELANSSKDRAENLMIVDLMRNDLARTCTNVKVEKLFEVTSYAQYHHMSSTITAETNHAPIDVIMGAMPPGSMTGAPKIAAINLCSKLEKQERGIYSGILGWLEPNACDFSVVIRTIILEGNKFEFQVGGGIVADSKPYAEYEEALNKAKAILQVLGLEKAAANL